MKGLLNAAAAAAAVMSLTASAHPGEYHSPEHVKRELVQRDHYAAKSARSLAGCADSIKARALHKRAEDRRAATAEKIRKERGIDKANTHYLHRRNLTALEEFEKTSHNETGVVDLTFDTRPLFSANTSCILTPEAVIGPYFVQGEHIRSDVRENQPGVPMHLDMQFIDVATCEPLPFLMVDIWAANSTGMYSGISVSDGQGGLNSTYMRGVQMSNEDGVVQFDSIFPGHYDGRATHQHVTVHTNATILPNNTYTGGTWSHIGQLFFDEALRSAVEATYPYNTNNQSVTSNDDDQWAPSQADNNYDPFPEYVYIGDDIQDGLLMWISIGIDTTANYTSDAEVAAYYWADGGHENSEGGMGGGMGGSAPSGAMSGSAMPSGTQSA